MSSIQTEASNAEISPVFLCLYIYESPTSSNVDACARALRRHRKCSCLCTSYTFSLSQSRTLLGLLLFINTYRRAHKCEFLYLYIWYRGMMRQGECASKHTHGRCSYMMTCATKSRTWKDLCLARNFSFYFFFFILLPFVALTRSSIYELLYELCVYIYQPLHERNGPTPLFLLLHRFIFKLSLFLLFYLARNWAQMNRRTRAPKQDSRVDRESIELTWWAWLLLFNYFNDFFFFSFYFFYFSLRVDEFKNNKINTNFCSFILIYLHDFFLFVFYFQVSVIFFQGLL